MHRHGYKGAKFGRERDQRRALIKGLADALILKESIETSLIKAKEVVSYTEKLITKAKKGDLHSRRQVIKGLATLDAAHKLVDELSPKLAGRDSGYLRVKKTDQRRGDNAQLARVSFVDNLKDSKTKKVEAKSTKTAATAQKTDKKALSDNSRVVAAEKSLKSGKGSVVQAPKRAGRRGDR